MIANHSTYHRSPFVRALIGALPQHSPLRVDHAGWQDHSGSPLCSLWSKGGSCLSSPSTSRSAYHCALRTIITFVYTPVFELGSGAGLDPLYQELIRHTIRHDVDIDQCTRWQGRIPMARPSGSESLTHSTLGCTRSPPDQLARSRPSGRPREQVIRQDPAGMGTRATGAIPRFDSGGNI